MIELSFADVGDIERAEAKFIKLAGALMNEWDIVLHHRQQQRLRISVLELYIHDARFWPDSSVHRFPEQLCRGHWYLHRDGKLPSKRLGLDISAGSRDPDIHVGLLVRGVEENDGPARAVNAILRGRTFKYDWVYTDQEKRFLKEEVSGRDVFSGPVRLTKAFPVRKSQLYQGPRFGLSKHVADKFRKRHLRVTSSASDKWAKTLITTNWVCA